MIKQVFEDQKETQLGNQLNISKQERENEGEVSQLMNIITDNENTIKNLRKKIEENESIMQDYCDIIQAQRTSKKQEENSEIYKGQIENILSIVTKNLESYSFRTQQTGKYKGFLEDNYAVKLFFQKFQLFQQRLVEFCKVIFSGLESIYEPSQIESQIPEINEQRYIPDSIDQAEEEFSKRIELIIVKRKCVSDVDIKVMKFCRVLNDIAEQLLQSANSHDEIIIEKLQSFFENKGRKNVVVVEFQMALMQLLKHWKHNVIENSEVYYQLSYYLKSLLDRETNESFNLDIAKHVAALSKHSFFGEVMRNVRQLDEQSVKKIDKSKEQDLRYHKFRKEIVDLVLEQNENFTNILERELTLEEKNARINLQMIGIKQFIPSHSEVSHNLVDLLQRLSVHLNLLREARNKNENDIIDSEARSAVIRTYCLFVRELTKLANSKSSSQRSNLLSAFEQFFEIIHPHANSLRDHHLTTYISIFKMIYSFLYCIFITNL